MLSGISTEGDAVNGVCVTGQTLRWLENMEKTSFVAAQKDEKEVVSPFCQAERPALLC